MQKKKRQLIVYFHVFHLKNRSRDCETTNIDYKTNVKMKYLIHAETSRTPTNHALNFH